MKKMIIFLFISIFAVSGFSETKDKDIIQYTDKLISNGKSVILIFGTKTCPYCEVLKKDLNTNKELKELVKDMNIYYIPKDEYKEYEMGDKKPPMKTNTTSLAMGFSIKTTPNILMFDKKWNKIFQIPGYADPSQMKVFLKFLKGLESGKYTKKEYKKYLKDEGMIK